MSWEAVIGLEIHVQLRSERKLFCADRAEFGAEPNRHVCPVCLGMPGALPVVNPEAVRLAVRAALALGCRVHAESVWARKNYFYPDLPKGYQITQFDRPLATGGALSFDAASGEERRVRMRRIHMEEDAGKLLHDRVPGATAVDLNRAGTPLVEIVTEPDLRDPADARAFLGALKRTLEYVDVSDCNMEEGSLRVDANVSVRRSGASGLGTKTEIKNVNSFSGIERALRQEIRRQTAVLEGGGEIVQETLVWDDHLGELRAMRSKEESHDYRYFPDPDLPVLRISAEEVERAQAELPELPGARRARFQSEYGLSAYDADVLTQVRATADYFEAVARALGDGAVAARWVGGPVQALLNQRGERADRLPLRPRTLVELVRMVEQGEVSDAAAKKLLPELADTGDEDVRALVEARGLVQVRDDRRLERWIQEVLASLPDEVERYRAGEERLLGFFVGQVMKASGGAADPRRVRELLLTHLGRA